MEKFSSKKLKKVSETNLKKENNMEFTINQLMVIEEALKIARDNTGDSKAGLEIWSVLSEVRSKLSGRNDIIVRKRIMSEIEKLRKSIDELEEEIEGYDFGSYSYDVVNGELEYSYARLDRLEKEEKNKKTLDSFFEFGILIM